VADAIVRGAVGKERQTPRAAVGGAIAAGERRAEERWSRLNATLAWLGFGPYPQPYGLYTAGAPGRARAASKAMRRR